MKKTNVFLEIEDNVYNTVVEPHKRSKTFSKLIAALLNGYINDEYVRAYGDEMVDDLRRASVDSLDEALESMHGSLANMGLFTDELQMVNSKGTRYFSKKKEDYESSTSNTQEQEKGKEGSGLSNSEEIQKLQEEVSSLESKLSSVLDQNKQILDLLKVSTEHVVREVAISKEENTVVAFEEEENLSFNESEMREGYNSYEENTTENIIAEAESVEEDIEETLDSVEEKPSFDMSFLSDAAISF